jgi:hypothetical protein
VCGGLGKGNVPLNDVYALNLHTLHWTRIVDEPFAVHNGISEPGPATWPSPLFGHSAFAIKSSGGDEILPECNEDELEEDPITGTVRSRSAPGGGSPGQRQRKSAPTAGTGSLHQSKAMAATAATAAATQQLLLRRANSADVDLLPVDPEWEEMLVIFGGSGVAPAAEQSTQNQHQNQHQNQQQRRRDDLGEVRDYTDHANTTTERRGGAKASDNHHEDHDHQRKHQHEHDHDHDRPHARKIGEVFDIPDSDDESANDAGGNSGDRQRGRGVAAYGADNKKYHSHTDDDGGGGGEKGNGKKGNKVSQHSSKMSVEQRAAAAAVSGCKQDTLVLDLRKGTWRKIHGSIAFPTKRTNHASCIIEGWAPGNPAVSPAVVNAANTKAVAVGTGAGAGAMQGGRTSSSALIHSASASASSSGPQVDDGRDGFASSRSFSSLAPGITTTAYVNDRYFSGETIRCGAVFGGSSTESMCSPDLWLLDLQWRWPGVSGFDENAETRTNAFLKNESAWSTHRVGSPTLGTLRTSDNGGSSTTMMMTTMKTSASMPAGLGMGFTATAATAATSDKVISKAFQKLKKERAHAEQLIVREADKNSWYKEELERTQAELAQVKLELKAAKVVKMPDDKLHDRIAQLTSELQASHEREKGLVELNNEAHRLLLLVGVKDFKERLGIGVGK